MGYDVHITRRAHWAEEGDDIPLEDWLAMAHADAEFEILPDGSGDLQGPDGQVWPLWWREGMIEAKNPDKAFISKMVTFADHLGATVQGDEGEVYRSDGSYYRHEGDQPMPPQQQPTPKKSWFSRLFGNS